MRFHTGAGSYAIEVPTTFVHEGAGPGSEPGREKPLLLLIHGFADTGASFLRRAFPALPARFEVLAPNGPFPLPKRVGDEWKEAYGWYFADIDANRIYVHPSVAAGALAALVEKLGLAGREKILCGFSQGGYFLPHLAARLKHVRRLITVGSGFHPRFFSEFGLAMPVDSVHGTGDDVIPLRVVHDDFKRLPNQGRFVEIPGMTHEINDAGRAALATLLEDSAEPLR